MQAILPEFVDDPQHLHALSAICWRTMWRIFIMSGISRAEAMSYAFLWLDLFREPKTHAGRNFLSPSLRLG
jgi:hypothetical protein